jgi:glyoxylase I family protein
MPTREEKGVVSGFHHVAIRVKDFDETVRFYKEGLGLRERLAWGEGDGRAVMLDAGNDNCVEIFAGGNPATSPAEGSIMHFALRTGDCDAALERARAAGARVTVEPKSVNIPARPAPVVVRIAFVRSPGGEVIEFFQEIGL